MRITLSKPFKTMLVFMVVVISLLYARYGSSLMTLVGRKGPTPVEVQRINREFQQLGHHLKNDITFGTENFTDFMNYIKELETEFARTTNILRRNVTDSNLHYLIEINTAATTNYINKIIDFDADVQKIHNTALSTAVQVNYRERLSVNESLKRNLLEELRTSRQTQTTRLQNQLDSVQAAIDSLNIAIAEQRRYTSNSLLLLKVNLEETPTKESLLLLGKTFGSRFLIGFVGLTLSILLIFFFASFVLFLFKLVGIRTKTGKGSGYSGYSGYGGYSYNKSKGRRKVKRIYKDSSKDDTKEE